jgi:hypothetical protein
MPAPSRPSRRVAVVIEASNAYARGLLAGIHRHVREHEPWTVFLPEHGRGAPPLEALAKWVGDGVIARIETASTAKAIEKLRRKLGIPVIDVSAARLIADLPYVETDDAAIESKVHAEMTSGRLEGKKLADQLEIDSTDFSKRIRYATLLFRYKSLGESQLETETLLKEFPAEAETHRLLASIYRERARESNDWNLRADAQERIALKLEAQKQASN